MDKKIKVLFVLPNLFGGGAERVFTYLVNHVDREQFKPYLALGAKTGAYLNDIKEDITIYELKGERARNVIPSLFKLVRILRPDTVFSTVGMNSANSLGRIFYPKGTRIVLREGSSVTAYLKDVARKSPATALIYRKIYKSLYNFPDAVICQSDYMLCDMVANLGVSEKILYRIYNPVDFDKIEKMLQEDSGKLFSDNVFNFLMVGNLVHCKGYDILLPAFAKVRQQNPNVSLTILGEGEERRNLEILIDKLNLNESVRMPGFAKNPHIYAKQADVFVSSSRYEGFSNAIVESLACGTPVVATDCPSAIREVLREGENGWLAKAEDETSLTETMLKAIEETKNLDAKEIRSDCKSRFGIENILPIYEKLLTP